MGKKKTDWKSLKVHCSSLHDSSHASVSVSVSVTVSSIGGIDISSLGGGGGMVSSIIPIRDIGKILNGGRGRGRGSGSSSSSVEGVSEH